jgi:hypothetical protein
MRAEFTRAKITTGLNSVPRRRRENRVVVGELAKGQADSRTTEIRLASRECSVMVIEFPVSKRVVFRPAARVAEARSHSFAFTLTLSAALSLALWAGLAAALVRL